MRIILRHFGLGSESLTVFKSFLASFIGILVLIKNTCHSRASCLPRLRGEARNERGEFLRIFLYCI
ncbi:MAG: hypothetical protein LBQ59_05585 [Candidatus Peribacteria bacterium]|nr:hypothetical protein [Candidatus Peribacteria bacterium]